MKLPSSHKREPGNFFIILHRSSDCLTTYRGLSVFFVKPTAFFICPQFLSFFIFAEENKLLKERITKSKSSPNEKTYVTQNVNNSDGPDFIPNMEVFTVGEDVTPKGAVIICPGGAFQFRSMQNEGYDVADMLVPMGYQCFIVNYRIAPYTMRESATDLQRAIRFLPRSYALVNLWGKDTYFNSRSMDVYVSRLRKRLKGDRDIQIINVHGKGYRLVVPLIEIESPKQEQ